MKILWLTPIFPYPPYSGGQTRSFNLIKNLAKKHQVALFSFWRPHRVQGPVGAMKKYCEKIKVFPGRPIWSAKNILRAGFSSLPFTITHFYGDQAVSRALKQGEYDLFHFESFYTSPYLTAVTGVPTVLGNENIEYLVYQRFKEQKKPPIKWFLSFDVAKMKRFEQKMWLKADLNLAVSDQDARVIRKVTGRQCPVIANGVDYDFFQQFKIEKPKKFSLLFVGDFKYFTNQDAVKFLVEKIWPKIQARYPDIILKLVGRNPRQWITNLASSKIIIDTGVTDIRQAYASADIFLAPMRIASGTNIKILEALAAGCPVVTTKVGAEGIKVQDRQELLIADSADELAGRVIELIHKPAKRRALSQAGKKLIKEHYDWPQIAKKLEGVYERLINNYSQL